MSAWDYEQGGEEDSLKYFNEWNGINPGAYEGLLRETAACCTTTRTSVR